MSFGSFTVREADVKLRRFPEQQREKKKVDREIPEYSRRRASSTSEGSSSEASILSFQGSKRSDFLLESKSGL